MSKEDRREFTALTKRVARQHPNASAEHKSQMVAARFFDYQQQRHPHNMGTGRQLVIKDRAEGQRLPLARKVEVPPKQRAPPRELLTAANSRSAAPQVLSVEEASALSKINAHLPFGLPAFSDSGAIPSATQVRGEGAQTFTLTPGQTLTVLGDPFNTGFGWYAVNNGPCPVIGTKTLSGEYVGGSIGNPGILPGATTGAFFSLLPFRNDPFNFGGYVRSDMYPPVTSTPQDEFFVANPYSANEHYICHQHGHLETDVSLSYNAIGQIFNIGATSAPRIFGPRTGLTTSNDGNPSDSVIYCSNPGLFDPNFSTVDDWLNSQVTPDLVAGSGNRANVCTATTMYNPSTDVWQRAGSSQAASPSQTFDTLNPFFGYYEPQAACYPPLVYRGDTSREPDLSTGTGAGLPNPTPSDVQIQAITSRYGMLFENIAKSVDGVYQVRNTGTEGTITITLRFSRTYGVFQPVGQNLARLSRPTFSFRDPTAKTDFGSAGTGSTHVSARLSSLGQLASNVLSFGGKVLPNVIRISKMLANKAMPTTQLGGLVAQIPTSEISTFQVPSAHIASRAFNAILGNRIGGDVDRGYNQIKSVGRSVATELLGREFGGGVASIANSIGQGILDIF